MEAIILVGLQGSGKSSCYKDRFFCTHVRISLDLLKTRFREKRMLEVWSARFSLLLGDVATFDCRISQMPNVDLVVDYFRWRNEDAARNALNAYCYWTLRKTGLNEREASQQLLGLSVAQKNELLFQYHINFNDVPNWQKRGVGLYWEEYDKPALNPVTGEEVIARRRRIKTIFDLPMKDEYSDFLRELLTNA
jgi:tRNA(His) guanylyltransferase